MLQPKSILATLALAFTAGCSTDIGDPTNQSPEAPPTEMPGTSGEGKVPGGATTPTTPGSPASNPGTSETPGETPSSSCVPGVSDTGASVLRRLSGLEYQATLQDLFQLTSPPSLEGIPADTDKEGFKIFAEVQSVSAQHLRAYLEKATELADSLIADKARWSKVVGCEANTPSCLSTFVTRFGALAWRRTLESDEVSALVSKAQTNALDTLDQFRFAIEALLTSTNFLYRVEIGDQAEGLSALKPHELASRLSFSLWGRAPSAELLERAESGELATADGLAEVADEMLSDPKAQQFFSAFFRQWLAFDTLRPPIVPPTGWNNELLGAMQAETDGLLREFAWTNQNFLDVLTTSRTQATPALARFFNLPTPSSDGQIEFPAGHVRAGTGLLTHPSLLSAKGDGDQIAIRGNWLRRTFLCKSLTIPAALADEIGETLVGLNPVEIVEKRNTETACKGCHAMIDPIGVGFSEFDSLGRFDPSFDLTQYGIQPALIDAPSPEYASIAELSAKLRALPEASECLVEKLFIYVNGRDSSQEDSCSVETAVHSFTTENTFPALVKGIVEGPAFRLRRAPVLTP